MILIGSIRVFFTATHCHLPLKLWNKPPLYTRRSFRNRLRKKLMKANSCLLSSRVKSIGMRKWRFENRYEITKPVFTCPFKSLQKPSSWEEGERIQVRLESGPDCPQPSSWGWVLQGDSLLHLGIWELGDLCSSSHQNFGSPPCCSWDEFCPRKARSGL